MNDNNAVGRIADGQSLKANSLGLLDVIFMVIATAAPITAMTGVVPVAVGFGNGTGAAAGYMIAMFVLLIFSVGYVAMSKHITSAGAFYGYISHGLGQMFGMASGLLTVVAYIAYEAAVAAIFAAFASTTSQDQFGVDIHWTVFALIYLILATFLGHRKIDFASKVLIILLFSEISILALMTIGVFINGGGPDGFVFSLLNPMEAFGGPSPGLGIFFAFSCWVGFESTALYGEESRNPKKIIPRATYICVISIGLFYVLVAWAAIIGNGLTQSIELSQTDPFALFFNPTSQYIGAWGVTIFQWLIITGSFACAIAFHNSAARYLYAIGREGFIHKSLGRTHRKHGSPYVASIVETIIVAIVLFLFWVNDFDPYLGAFTLLTLLGAACIFIVQALCSFAVIGYFQKNHRESRHWFKTFLAPLIGGLCMILMLVLLVVNVDALVGEAGNTVFFKMIPWIVLGVFLLGIGGAFYLRIKRPEKYAILGRMVMTETKEREEEQSA